MSDTVTVKAGSVVRIVTTGGGGWGDPLRREVDKVVYDVRVRPRLRSRGARETTASCSGGQGGSGRQTSPATEKLARIARRQARALPMFDRGPYFEELKKQGGAPSRQLARPGRRLAGSRVA